MRKTFLILLSIALLITCLSGCDTEGTASEAASSEADITSENASSEADVSQLVETPAEEFLYEINENGKISITKYKGNEESLIIPKEIDGKEVECLKTSAFENDTKLVTVTIPDSVTTLYPGVFLGCTSLVSVKLSENLKVIGSGAFKGCTSLNNIVLPQSLIRIDDIAFSNCNALKSITIPKNITEWGKELFSESGIETIEFQDGLTCIGEYAFLKTKIKRIELPNSLKFIDNGAFRQCEQLETIVLNEGLMQIGNYAFYGTKISSIVIPSTVTGINELAFVNCNSLKHVKFEGDSPAEYAVLTNEEKESYIIYYHEGAEGFTSPEWNGYTTEIW